MCGLTPTVDTSAGERKTYVVNSFFQNRGFTSTIYIKIMHMAFLLTYYQVLQYLLQLTGQPKRRQVSTNERSKS
jgi:hypothetical protein